MAEHELDADPIAIVVAWLEEARAAVPLAETMALATATPDGRPSVRMVILRGLDKSSFVFFTNRTSRKADELRENPRAALCLHWWELGRQVRAEGGVEELSASESAAYWATRPRASQLAAWASRQSRPLASREELLAEVRRLDERFSETEVPLPPFWGGYRVLPDEIELWTHRDDRLHDRVRYRRDGPSWRSELLAP
jgi:pyridoxamine 5'-phosphate oxidase